MQYIDEVAIQTLYILVIISIAPGTVANRVVCFVENPNDSEVCHQLFLYLTRCWINSPMMRFVIAVNEFEMLQLAAYPAKAHGFQSVSASLNCSFFHLLFSTPVLWFFRRSIAMILSSFVKNLAFIGESGMKNQKQIPTMNVTRPQMTMKSCHGSKVSDFRCEVPNDTNPLNIWAVPFMRNQ